MFIEKEQDIIQDIIINELEYKYSAIDENFIQILLLRFIFIKNINIDKISNLLDISEELTYFVLEELNIFIDGNHIYYKNQKIPIYSFINFSVTNIVENMLFQYNYRYDDLNGNKLLTFLKSKQKQIHKYAKLKKTKYSFNLKNLKYMPNIKNEVFLYFALYKINSIFNIKIKYTNDIKEFKQTEVFYIVDDYCYNQLQHFLNSSNNKNVLTEKDVEDYIVKNIKKIDPKLIFVDRQVLIEDVVIDILARDKDNNYYIIEVKNDIDEKIIWQSIYYPKAFYDKFKKKTKMIVVSTVFNQALIDSFALLNENNFDISVKELNVIIANKKIIQGSIHDIY